MIVRKSKALLLLLFFSGNVPADVVFDVEDMLDWKNKRFDGETQYSLQSPDTMIKAVSRDSASGLFFESEIDLQKTPVINWSWKVEKFPTVVDEKIKAGDDFAARVYIVVQDGWTFLSSRAISYVWSQQTVVDEAWANPYTGKRAMMISVESSTTTGVVKIQKRNVREDLKRLFGKDFKKIHAVAIMTDSDSSASSAEAFYSGITFTDQ